jgi:hypothetical protein
MAWTRTEAFRFYNTEPRNAHWSWSAKSEDEKTVAVTLWKNEFSGPAGQMKYEKSNIANWFDGPGRRFFFEDLAWAVQHCGGLVRVIVVVRDETSTSEVRVADCYPQKNLIMRVVQLDPDNGAFTLHQVVPPAAHATTSPLVQSSNELPRTE